MTTRKPCRRDAVTDAVRRTLVAELKLRELRTLALELPRSNQSVPAEKAAIPLPYNPPPSVGHSSLASHASEGLDELTKPIQQKPESKTFFLFLKNRS